MISLSDGQLQIVTRAAANLSPEKRGVFLERIAGELERRGRFTDADVAAAAQRALSGLVQEVA